MNYRIQYRKYGRRFRKPFITAGYARDHREGILVKMVDEEGKVGFGEVAPLKGFAVESLADAERWLISLEGKLDIGKREIPHGLPCCRFAISGALAWITDELEISECKELPTACLLPAGEDSIRVQEERRQEGYLTYKWKIGVGKLDDELDVCEKLVHRGTLRLDANGGLSTKELAAWLEIISKYKGVEFLEQPLPPGQWKVAQEMAEECGLCDKIALDEEVTTLEQIRKIQSEGFVGKIVMKSAMAGWMNEAIGKTAIHSSALETAVGKETALRLAIHSPYVLGFGVSDLFEEDDLELHPSGPKITVGKIGTSEFERIWEKISDC